MAASLDAFLNSHAAGKSAQAAQVAATIRLLSEAAILVRKSINEGALGAAFAGARGEANVGGDAQRDLDVYADDQFLAAARKAGVAWYASEELDRPVAVQPDAPLAIAIDPLDGSSNIDTNVSIGTIFSLLPSTGEAEATFRQTGDKQLAAGFFIYGPQLALALSVGSGVGVFVFSSRVGGFVEAYKSVSVENEAKEFAINASNYRHWDESMRLYFDDCISGEEGPRGRNFNMRWIASLVADAYRILMRGGVFLYPRDNRRGYSAGRLRLVYEANPIAFLAEQAGGAATDGIRRILEIAPQDLHQRTPLVFGARREVDKIGRYLSNPSAIGNRHPLFGNRGLFRA